MGFAAFRRNRWVSCSRCLFHVSAKKSKAFQNAIIVTFQDKDLVGVRRTVCFIYMVLWPCFLRLVFGLLSSVNCNINLALFLHLAMYFLKQTQEEKHKWHVIVKDFMTFPLYSAKLKLKLTRPAGGTLCSHMPKVICLPNLRCCQTLHSLRDRWMVLLFRRKEPPKDPTRKSLRAAAWQSSALGDSSNACKAAKHASRRFGEAPPVFGSFLGKTTADGLKQQTAKCMCRCVLV